MPDIRLRNQPFDVTFHPTRPLLFTALLTGEVRAFRYDDNNGEASSSWAVRPSKRAARALSVEGSGAAAWMGGKAGSLFQLNCESGTIMSERPDAHEAPINRVYCINPQLIASGDDDGVIKFWDTRQQDCLRTYPHHFDYVSDFTYFDDKRQLVATSGDGHLSAIDIRSSKSSPLVISDDQEDELLSITPIKDGSKVVVGSGLGILSVWDRKKGWGDCVDRIPGHPASIDAVVALTSDVIASGSEDGMVRVMQILPNKFLGVIATHEDYPIERIKLDRNKKWLASISHDECIKLTDCENLLEDSDDEGEDEGEDTDMGAEPHSSDDEDDEMDAASSGSSADEGAAKKSTTKKKRGGMGDMGRGGTTNGGEAFFDDL